MQPRLLWFLLATAPLPGCAATPDPDPFQAVCEQLAQCDCWAPEHASVEACVTDIRAWSTDDQEAVEADGFVYDLACVEQTLLHEASAWACGTDADVTVDDNMCPHCPMVHGQVALGGYCNEFGYYGSDCAPGLVCDVSTCVNEWRCNKLAVGDVCAELMAGLDPQVPPLRVGGCPVDSFCDRFGTARCESRGARANGEACTLSLYCASGHCVDDVCTDPPIGEACEFSLDDPNTPDIDESGQTSCEGYLCIDGTCAGPFAEGESCVGTSGITSYFGLCAEGLECDPDTETCRADQPLLCWAHPPDVASRALAPAAPRERVRALLERSWDRRGDGAVGPAAALGDEPIR